MISRDIEREYWFETDKKIFYSLYKSCYVSQTDKEQSTRKNSNKTTWGT